MASGRRAYRLSVLLAGSESPPAAGSPRAADRTTSFGGNHRGPPSATWKMTKKGFRSPWPRSPRDGRPLKRREAVRHHRIAQLVPGECRWANEINYATGRLLRGIGPNSKTENRQGKSSGFSRGISIGTSNSDGKSHIFQANAIPQSSIKNFLLLSSA